MTYNFKQIEKKWQKFWSENQTFKVENDCFFAEILYHGHVSISLWSRIACRSSARLLSLVIFIQDIKDLKDLMFYILKVMIHLDYQLSNMQFKQEGIQRKLLKRISHDIENN